MRTLRPRLHAVRAHNLTADEILEREPYAPEVGYQSRRAYVFSRKPEQVHEA